MSSSSTNTTCRCRGFVFKFNKSAKAAVTQIRTKGYADAYKADKRPVTLVGVNFRNAKRNIDEPLFAVL